jgi:YD repeat-containing protein
MRTQTDANSHTLAMRYDDLGRLRERDVPLDNGSTETSVWTYDVNLSADPAAKALGRINSIKHATYNIKVGSLIIRTGILRKQFNN